MSVGNTNPFDNQKVGHAHSIPASSAASPSISPTPEVAKAIFWGLGDQFWKQIIDFKYQQYGPQVFDEGLHGDTIEPGFFQSLLNGCHFVSAHMTEEPSVQFYKDLHKTLCAHFNGERTSTEMAADKTGIFRNNGCQCKMSNRFGEEKEEFLLVEISKHCGIKYPKIFARLNDAKAKKHIEDIFYNLIVSNSSNSGWLEEQETKWMAKTDIAFQIREHFPAAQEKIQNLKNKIHENKIAIQQYLTELAAELGEDRPLASLIEDSDEWTYVHYSYSGSEDHERITQKLFDRYNRKMREVNTLLKDCPNEVESKRLREEKIDLIADLYQLLEWLHPFQDGQGRTDLVLLAKLLSDQGFNPAILEEPYFSSTATPAQWRAHLREGIQRFRDMK